MNAFKNYKFDDFVLNTSQRSLSKSGEEIEIPSKTFDLLFLLVRKNGEVVTKDQILENVWQGSFVEESNLTVQIAKLRKLFKPSKFIKTVQGIGYQFTVSVEALNQETQQNENIKISIAVIPFKNENGDEKFEYLADGLTEGLINSFSYSSDIRVLARETVFHYKDSDENVLEIGEKLKVENVLTGRLRIIEDNLIVGVELVKVSDGAQIWGTQINEKVSDIFEIQNQLTTKISEKLKTKFGETRRSSKPTQVTKNTESYKFYLKGEYFSHKRSLNAINKAIECFQASISYDSLNALSYIGLAKCYFWTFLGDYSPYEETAPIIETLFKKATEISPDNPDLNVIKGRVAMNFEKDFQKAESYFQKALKVNPDHIEAFYPYSYLLAMQGKFSEAFEKLDSVTAIDPFALKNGTRIARTLYYMEEYGEAIAQSKNAIESDATDFMPYWIIGVSLCELKKYDEAFEYLEKSLEINYHLETYATIGYVHARKGNEKEALEIIENLKTKSVEENVSNMYFAMIYCALGEKDKAFEYLEDAAKVRDSDILTLKVNPRFANLHDDERFGKLLERIGFGNI